MTFNFMSSGIPVVYAGQEHGFSGAHDPDNREALWTSGFANSTAYQFIARLNTLRNFLIKTSEWATAEASILTSGPTGVGIHKDGIVSIMTTIGSPPSDSAHISVKTPFPSTSALTNIITCRQFIVASGGMVDAQYEEGGQAVILVPSERLKGSGLCGHELADIDSKGGTADALSSALPNVPSLMKSLGIGAFFTMVTLLCTV